MKQLDSKRKTTKIIIKKTEKVYEKRVLDHSIVSQKESFTSQLIYSDDASPGFSRKKLRNSFQYYDINLKKISSKTIINRINKLAIPPAYSDVWICAHEYGHIQATARDARGRKQYRYHDEWQQIRSANKFDRLLAFSKVLPIIRKKTQGNLKINNLTRDKILASLIYLLDSTLIRIGNDEYARDNQSYGLTTLRNKHLKIENNQAHFHFNGKSGVEHNIFVGDKRLVKLLKQCLEIPGQNIFQYIDEDGNPHRVGSGDVNDYLREISGDTFTAKDFRTWAACVLTINALQEAVKNQNKLPETRGYKIKETTKKEAVTEAVTKRAETLILKKNITQVIKQVAQCLGNTPAVCRSNYIHPAILDAYHSKSFPFNVKTKKPVENYLKCNQAGNWFRPGEKTLALFLKKIAT